MLTINYQPTSTTGPGSRPRKGQALKKGTVMAAEAKADGFVKVTLCKAGKV